MTQQKTQARTVGRRGTGWTVFGLIGLVVLFAGLATGFCRRVPVTSDDPPVLAPNSGDGALFATWPKGVKPDAVLVLSGQSFGYLQPCGCSRPQKGGLERRANFIASLRAKDWPVAGADLGDLLPDRHPTAGSPGIGPSGILPPPEQDLAKYVTMMNALREMGYVAVGVGKSEFEARLTNVVAQYGLQKEQPPFVLAGNVLGLADAKTLPPEGKTVPQASFFPPGPGGTRPTVGIGEVAEIGKVQVGIVGLVGPSLARTATKIDPTLWVEFSGEVLGPAIQGFAARKRAPDMNLLLYQGTIDEAKKLASEWPQFSVILCQASDPEPPSFPQEVVHKNGQKTLFIQVGHKGQYVGVVGLFKKAGGGYDLKYQLVPMGEEYLTPDDPKAEKANRALTLLEDYAHVVKDGNFQAKVTKTLHPAQIQAANLNLSYVGSDRCQACHGAEYVKWTTTPHSHALETLETRAKRPGLRNLDGECLVCHTIGYGFKTGYENEKKTPRLANVGCESCHGPGSGHVSAPHNGELLKLLSPWKKDKTDKLLSVETMDKVAKMGPIERNQVVHTLNERQVLNGVNRTCSKCHDQENDPHFELEKYWPKIVHGGLAAAGGGLPMPKR